MSASHTSPQQLAALGASIAAMSCVCAVMAVAIPLPAVAQIVMILIAVVLLVAAGGTIGLAVSALKAR